MIEFIKKNGIGLLTLVGVIILVLSVVLPKTLEFGALDRTTVANPWTFSGAVTHSGTVTNSGAVSLTSTLKVGSSGDSLTRVNIGTCYIRARATTIVASSTAIVECQATALVKDVWTSAGASSALTGVSQDDAVVVTLATSTANALGGSANGGIFVVGATASTTQGYIQLLISNQTGATFTWPLTGSASGTASYIVADK